MFTRQHYKEIAATLAAVFASMDDNNSVKEARAEGMSLGEPLIGLETAKQLVLSAFLCMFDNDNPRFDETRFIEAARPELKGKTALPAR